MSFDSFRIVRNRGNLTDHPSPPPSLSLPSTTTTTEEISRTSQATDVYSIHSLLHHPPYEYSTLKQRSSAIRLNGNIFYSDIPLVFRGSLMGMEEKSSFGLDFAELTREQQELLEKFFRENPWMENVSIDIIGKQTGFPESMIKVRLTIISFLIFISFFRYISIKFDSIDILRLIISIMLAMNLFQQVKLSMIQQQQQHQNVKNIR